CRENQGVVRIALVILSEAESKNPAELASSNSTGSFDFARDDTRSRRWQLERAMFVDRVKVFAQAGNGARGCVSFRGEKFVPKGGHDGGDGGRGGKVILRADRHVDNLSNLFYEPLIKAKNGGHGMGKKMTGRTGADKIMKVPVGTIVWPV